MKISKLLPISAICVALSACSSPEGEARAIIADYCDAFKNKDSETLKELTTDPKLASFPFWSDSDRENATCGEEVKTLSDEKFVFILSSKPLRMPIIVEKVDDNFMITGLNTKQY